MRDPLDGASRAEVVAVLGLLLIVGVTVATASPSAPPSADVEAWQTSSSACGVEVALSFGEGSQAADRVVIAADRPRDAQVVDSGDAVLGGYDARLRLQRGTEISVVALDDELGETSVLAEGRLTSTCEFADGSP